MLLEEQKRLPNNEELDLAVFFANFRKFLRLVIIPGSIVALIGLFSGLLFARKAPAEFSNSLILRVGVLNNEEVVALVDSWHNLLKTNQQQQLSTILQCPVELLKQVSDLKATSILNENNNNLNGIIITTTVMDTSVLPALQQALIAGFEHNELISNRLIQQKKQLTQLLSRINIEVKELDSLKKAINGSQGSLFSSRHAYGISSINSELVALTEKKIKYEGKLSDSVAVSVLQSFVRNPLPKANLYAKQLFSFTFIGFLIGVIVGGVRFLRVRYPFLFSSKQNMSPYRSNNHETGKE